MQYYITIVHQDPATGTFSLDSEGENPLFLQLPTDMIGEPLYLSVRASAAYHKIVGKGRKVLHFEYDEIFRFSFQRCVYTLENEFL